MKKIFIILVILLLAAGCVKEKSSSKEEKNNSPEQVINSLCYSCTKDKVENKEKKYEIENYYDFCIDNNELTNMNNYQIYRFQNIEEYQKFNTISKDFKLEKNDDKLETKLYLNYWIPFKESTIEEYIQKLEKDNYKCKNITKES